MPPPEIPLAKMDEPKTTEAHDQREREREHQTPQGRPIVGDQRIEPGAAQPHDDPLDATRQFQAMHPSAELPANARGAQFSAINARLQAEASTGTPSAQPLQVTFGDTTFTGVLSGPKQGQRPELMVPGQPPQKFVVDLKGNDFVMHPVNKDGSLGNPIRPDAVKPATDAFSAHQAGAPLRISDLKPSQPAPLTDGAKFYTDYSKASEQQRRQLADQFANSPNKDLLARGMSEAAQRDPRNAKSVLDDLTRNVQEARERTGPRSDQPAPGRTAERAPESDKPPEVRPQPVAQTETIRQAAAIQRQEKPDGAQLREREFTGSTDRAAAERVVSRVETTPASTTGPHPSTADIRHVAFADSNDGRVQQIMLQGRATVFTQAHEVQQVTSKARVVEEPAMKGRVDVASDTTARSQAQLAAERGAREQGRAMSDQAGLKGRGQPDRVERVDARALPVQLALRLQELIGKGTLLSNMAARSTEVTVRPTVNAFDALRNMQASDRVVRPEPTPGVGAGGLGAHQAERPFIPGLNSQDARDQLFVAEAMKQLVALRLTEFNPRVHDIGTMLQGLDATKVGKLQEFLTNEAAGSRSGTLTQQQFIGRLTDIVTGRPVDRKEMSETERLAQKDAEQRANEQKANDGKAHETEEEQKVKDQKAQEKSDEQVRKIETLKIKNSEALDEMKAKKLREQQEKEMRDKELALAQIKKNEENTRRRRYIIRERDTLQSIALRQLRDVRLASLIYQINKSVIPITSQRGKKVYVMKVGQVILLPSGNEIKGFRGVGLDDREKSEATNFVAAAEDLEQEIEDEKFKSAEDELAAKFGSNWDGEEEDAEPPSSSTAGDNPLIRATANRVGKFGRSMGASSQNSEPSAPHPVVTPVETAAAKSRREHVEELLGPVSKKSEVPSDERVRYVARLGDTLKSICVKHPALQDVTLWPLLAQVNDMPVDTDSGAQLPKLARGAVLVMPTSAEISDFRGANRSGHGTTRSEHTSVKCISCGNATGSSDTVCSACRAPAPPPPPPATVESVSSEPAKADTPDAAMIIMQAAGFMLEDDEEES